MKKIFKKAHKMTREMVNEYRVDYQAQFGLCLSYLLKNKEEDEMRINFKGTERQIEFAEDIFEKTIGRVLGELEQAIAETEFREESTREKAYTRLEETKEKLQQLDAGDFISKWKWYLDEPYIRIINDAQDWLDETTGVRVSGRAWMTLQEKNYEEI